jgi:hypothetical protein
LPAALVALAALTLAAAEPEPGKKYKDDYFLPLKGEPAGGHAFEYYGPDAEACVRFEPDGLRLSLPRGYPGLRPGTGLTFPVAAQGDFEVTATYDILQEPEPAAAGAQTTRFTLDAVMEGPGATTVATLSRNVNAAMGTRFFAWMRVWDEAADKDRMRNKWFPAKTKTGRLRMTRTGSDLSYHASEGPDGDFFLITRFPFVTEDLKAVRLVGATGDPGVALEVRATDLRLRAESLPGKPGLPEPAAGAGRKGWLAAGILVGLALVGSSVLVVWLLVRRSGRAGLAPAGADDPGQPAP